MQCKQQQNSGPFRRGSHHNPEPQNPTQQCLVTLSASVWTLLVEAGGSLLTEGSKCESGWVGCLMQLSVLFTVIRTKQNLLWLAGGHGEHLLAFSLSEQPVSDTLMEQVGGQRSGSSLYFRSFERTESGEIKVLDVFLLIGSPCDSAELTGQIFTWRYGGESLPAWFCWVQTEPEEQINRRMIQNISPSFTVFTLTTLYHKIKQFSVFKTQTLPSAGEVYNYSLMVFWAQSVLHREVRNQDRCWPKRTTYHFYQKHHDYPQTSGKIKVQQRNRSTGEQWSKIHQHVSDRLTKSRLQTPRTQKPSEPNAVLLNVLDLIFKLNLLYTFQALLKKQAANSRIETQKQVKGFTWKQQQV